MDNDPELKEWASDWQAGRDPATPEEAVRQYTKRRGNFLVAWMICEFVIGGIALPLLAYMGWSATNEVERLTMTALASLTFGLMWFGVWNWSGVVDSSALATTEFVALSVRRLQHMRQALQIGWVLLAAEVVLFSIWIWNLLYGGGRSHTEAAERFAWGWLAGVTTIAVVCLIAGGRWVARDTARLEVLRRELDVPDDAVTSPGPRPPASGPGPESRLRAKLRSRNRGVPR
jgi:hypothetical protein